VCFDLVCFCFRKILLYPRGDEVDDHLAMYLEAVETANMSKGWSRNVKFKFLVFNQLDTNMTISEGIIFFFFPPNKLLINTRPFLYYTTKLTPLFDT
jgi:hypothetical protein